MNPEDFAQQDERLRIAIKALETGRAEIRARFADEFGIVVGEGIPAGQYVIQVERNAVFNPVVARSVLSQDEYESILVNKPDTTQAKRVLSPARYESCQKEGAPKMIIKRVED